MTKNATAPSIAIAGATGFIGRGLIHSIQGKRPVIALSRSESRFPAGIESRQADFFATASLAESLRGVKVAVYLVHSMMPTARLDQSRFEDTDLWLADTFAQAAAEAGVERIIYLGGIIPDGDQISRHLLSRKEVEDALGSTGIPVVTLRAGLILGAAGSSFQMLYLLVKRLPWMVCPQWAWTETQPISELDVIRLIEYCIDHPELTPGSYDIGGPDITTYLNLMRECADVLKLKRSFFNVPFFTPGLSTLWVCLVTGASRNLVSPLVRSLTHPMLVRNRVLIDSFGKPLERMSEALRRALLAARPELRQETRSRRRARSGDHWVRSIQRLPVSPDSTALSTAQDYFRWLQTKLYPWIAVSTRDDGQVQILVRFFRWNWVLLQLCPVPGADGVSVASYQVTGGALSKPQVLGGSARGLLEFRISKNRLYSLVGLHGFSPRLPWLIYKYTQAMIHLVIMRAFSSFKLQVKGV